jgi:hypothetical protein
MPSKKKTSFWPQPKPKPNKAKRFGVVGIAAAVVAGLAGLAKRHQK